MLKSHEKFHSANGKRLVLIADDEAVNREMLQYVLRDHYEILLARDGIETMQQILDNRDTLSVVLLDLQMPKLSGIEVIRRIKEHIDPVVRQIPVIVMTADQDAEVECLTLGAIDFIPKPYPRKDVVLARMLRTIELSEDRQIINSTERDHLTGLYNREYFYRYAEQFDHHHKNLIMDAIVVDINHFHMINERFGTAFGDAVLRRIGESIRSVVSDSGGIVCRREADTFLVYCPHGKNYERILESAAAGLSAGGDGNSRVRLRMGVYANVDKTLEIERRFDRAKMAADTVKGTYTRPIGIYDSLLHEKEMYTEQLVEDFDTAIAEKQFVVYFQPKFDIRADSPVLASAEALVRWKHPKLGLIAPGVFIPLFEENGLIQTLDRYVWKETAAQIRRWKERFDFTVSVSVNVSRIDMYDPCLVDTLQQILTDNRLTPHEFLLEITESAYTEDSDQIIKTVSALRHLGFRIEMDDFGTGYSSLNMISALPIDGLKLDMQFIRNAFSKGRDTRMLEVIVDIADYLSVPVIAEGVETEEQMLALKAMGCDFIQGYFFSRPVPAEEYEQFVIRRKKQREERLELSKVIPEYIFDQKEVELGRITHLLSGGFEKIYYVDIENHHYAVFSSKGRHDDLEIENSGRDFFADLQSNISRMVYEEDRARVSLCLKKDALIAQLSGSRPFSMTYRLQRDGQPVYYNLKAVRANPGDKHHIVIGISNVDAQIRETEPAETHNELDFHFLAQSLASDMESIYYVDTLSDSYMEFHSEGLYGKLHLEGSRNNFFLDCRRNILAVVYPDDQAEVLHAMEKERLLRKLREQGVFTMVYRLMIEGQAVYFRLKAVRAEQDDGHHIVIGLSNIDSQVMEEKRLRAERRSAVTFAGIAQALAADYFSIYYVDTETDRFIEYSSHGEYAALDIEKGGTDFFGISRRNCERVVHPDDVEMFLSVFSKEKILAELEQDRTFTLTYRLMFDRVPVYVHMKATRMEDRRDRHIVIGISNVDEQIRREQEYARALRMANQDALTGVKSKHAYAEEETKINEAIREGRQGDFAVALCDVNNLKQMNDTWGHAAGDQLLKDACMIVCQVFRHSPVFRVGGDEFVAILRGGDYEKRISLVEMLSRSNRDNVRENGPVVACGIADYDPARDDCLAAVFNRADAAMYANKKKLKGELV